MATIGSVTVSPLRVRSLLLSALGLFSKGSDEGNLWIKGDMVSIDPLIGSRHGFCSVGAIDNVPGFTDEERTAARIALAKMIDEDRFSGHYLEDWNAEYDNGYSSTRITFENRPELATDMIVDSNDDYDTEFDSVRRWFSNAAAYVKRGVSKV